MWSEKFEELRISDVEELKADGISEVDSTGSLSDGMSSMSNMSIASSIYAGHIENGRRYQTLREGQTWWPSDEKQFEHMEALHIMLQILDFQQANPFFRSPITDVSNGPTHILDVGTGNGAWPRDLADRFPHYTVEGIDLYPPPNTWMPPNCTLTVEDVLKPWAFGHKFSLVHLRGLFASFEPAQWHAVYSQAYENLEHGGWIEEVEPVFGFNCDDNTLPPDSILANFSTTFDPCFAASGKHLNTAFTMIDGIRAAGFVNIHVKEYKVPFGKWTKNPLLKEAGMFNKLQFEEGMEGFCMHILTNFGLPVPWSKEKVDAYVEQFRKELNSGWHVYWVHRRVWAMKPFDNEIDVDMAG